MQGSNRRGGIGLRHDQRDVPLGRALRDRDDVDPFGAERAEHGRGDAGRPAHAIADRRHDGHRLRRDLLDVSARQLELERPAQRLDHTRRIGGGDDEAHVVLGGRLRNHQHVRLLLGHDFERLRDDARNALHPGAADGDEADAANRGHRLDARHRRIAFDAHARARMRRVEAVQDAHRDALAERGQDRLVVQHLRAVVRQLRRLAVRDLRRASARRELPTDSPTSRRQRRSRSRSRRHRAPRRRSRPNNPSRRARASSARHRRSRR